MPARRNPLAGIEVIWGARIDAYHSQAEFLSRNPLAGIEVIWGLTPLEATNVQLVVGGRNPLAGIEVTWGGYVDEIRRFSYCLCRNPLAGIEVIWGKDSR